MPTLSQVPFAENPKPSVPPPPPASVEVNIRTLESDLALMGKSLEEAARAISRPSTAVQMPGLFDGRKVEAARSRANMLVWGVAVAVGVVVLFFAGYFLLPLILGENPPASPPPAGPASPAALPTSTSPAPIFLGYDSFLRKPVDEKLNIPAENPLTPAYYDIYLSAFQAALTGARPESSLVEAVLKKNDGQAVAWTQFLSFLDIVEPSADFWNGRFEPGFNLVLSREDGKWRPTYILKLRGSTTPLALQTTLLKLEADPNLPRLFLGPPAAAGEGFKDAQFAGQPVRKGSFGPDVLLYGWPYNQYLVISASEAGFREAMLRL